MARQNFGHLYQTDKHDEIIVFIFKVYLKR